MWSGSEFRLELILSHLTTSSTRAVVKPDSRA